MNDSMRNTDSGLEVSNNATNSRSSASPTPSPRRVRSPRDSELCATADIPVISPEQIDVLSSHRLGKGTYGHVVRARYRPNTQAEWRTVAIKYANEAIMRNTLKREAKIMHQLQYNKHCIKIYGIYNCLRNGVGVVMEYMDCKSLAELLVNKNIDYKIDNAISWLYQLSDAVDYFHSKEQVHRDLKCQNLLLSDRYRCLKLCDFGTFTTLHNSMTSNRGTPITMAPEIFRGEQYNTKCDIYSFGIIMWQVIARRNPYSKVDANVLLWNVASTNRRPPELTCHPILLQFYKRCWHHDQNMRPSSSEVKEYFAILREYYPNGNEPLIDTSTNEPARTPQPSQITNGHALLSYGQGGPARLHPYGHRRAGSDGSTLIVKERLPTDPPVQHLGDGGIGPVAGPPDMRTTRSQSVADGLSHIRGSATPTAPRARLSSETDDTEDILEFFDPNFHPAPPDPRDPASLQLRDEHIALLHVLHDHIMKRDAKFREKHSMIRTLDQLEECKKRRDLRDRLKTELSESIKRIQGHK